MPMVVIAGAGVMGTAFTFPLVDAGCRVRLVGTPLDEQHIEVMKNGQVHPRLGTAIDDSVEIYYASQLGEALRADVDLVVIGVSSAGIGWAIENLGPLVRTTMPILLLSKGLTVEDGHILSLPEKVQRGLAKTGVPEAMVGGVGGPCIAGELAGRRHTSVVVSFTDQTLVDRIVPLLQTEYYHVAQSSNLTGVEGCAALKNLYALGIGAPQGMLERKGEKEKKVLMHNLASALFSQAIQEMAVFEQVFSGGVNSAYGLAGAGDLYVTCQAGRNSRMGRLLGMGMRYSEAKKKHMADDTIEGAELATAIGPAVKQMFGDGRLDKREFPLAEAIIAAVVDDERLEFAWKRFHRLQPVR